MLKKTNTLKFHSNDHLIKLIVSGAKSYEMDETQYVNSLVKNSLHEFENRIEWENPSNVLDHYKDAMNFFQFKDANFVKFELERKAALELKLTCKEYKRKLVEMTTMFICYSILRD